MLKNRTKHLIQLFFISFSLFIYEILIVRVFSILFLKDFLFLMISLAILGVGVGGILYKWVKRLKNENLIFAFYPFSFPLSLAAVIWFFPFLGTAGTVFSSLAPFLLGGMILASFYEKEKEQSGLFYGFDLAGGVTGCLVSLLLVDKLGVQNTILLSGLFAAVPYFLDSIGNKGRLSYALIHISILCVLFFTHLLYPFLAIGPESLKKTTTFLGRMLNYQRVKAKWLGSTWDVYSRCDLISAAKKGNKKSIFINAGSEAVMLRYDGMEEMRKDYGDDVIYFPYKFGNNEKVLVIGAGGGQDVLMALLGGARHVTAVEINEGVVRLTRQEGDYNGDIYNRPEVEVVIEDGRTWLMRNHNRYDRIVLNLASTYAFSDMAAMAQMENYLYTQEAFSLYFDHLAENGELTIMINFPQLAEKFLHTGYDYYSSQGIRPEDASSFMLALAPADWSYLLFFRNTPFKPMDVDKIKAEADRIGIRLLSLPFYHVDYSQDTLAELITTDFNAVAAGKHLPQYYRARSPYRLDPATDDKPFFLEVILNQRMMLFKLFVGAALLILFLLVWYWIWDRKNLSNQGDGSLGIIYCVYFVLIGAGFMAVEMGYLKRFSFYFGYPQLTLAVTIGALLGGAGSGSLFAQRFLGPQKRQLQAIALLILPLLLVAHQLTLTPFINATIAFPLIQRCLLFFAYIAPSAFLMGFFFPTGLKAAGNHRPQDIPWFYGINGLASVAGSVLSVIVAMSKGIGAVFFLAAILYATASFLIIALSSFKPSY